MYCSRRGRRVSRPTDTCSRCGRCHWEQAQDNENSSPVMILLLAAAALLGVILFFTA